MGTKAKDRITLEDIAYIAHETNRAYCTVIGDESKPAWDEASEEIRSATLQAVEFSLNNSDARTSDMHDIWFERKKSEGFRLGPKKDNDKKEHPWLMRFDDLPREQQAKGKLFLAVTRVLRFVMKSPSGQ